MSPTRRYGLELEMRYELAQFATASRLRTEPALGAPVPPGFNCGSSGRLAPNRTTGASDGRFWGCEDVSFTPAYPQVTSLAQSGADCASPPTF